MSRKYPGNDLNKEMGFQSLAEVPKFTVH